MRSREVYRRCGRRTGGEGHVSFGFLAYARFSLRLIAKFIEKSMNLFLESKVK